jgi:1-deoxy-D-xylulose-5-phosphate reductoisomerase
MASLKRIAVIGSTGSIGKSALDVIARHPDKLRLVGLAARSRIDGLAEQWAAFNPPYVAVWDASQARELAARIRPHAVWSQAEGLTRLVTQPDVDLVLVAALGSDVLVPIIRAIQAGKQIALASKELLVMAGGLIMRLAREHGTRLVPIDSEHAALFQCLHGVPPEQVARLTVTGSGGSLWNLPADALGGVSREQVLAHPKWRMGPKITVDSATLMNKGLEVIEARWLFNMPLERISVVVHPEAVVHAIVEMIDGTLLAQMSLCDMRLPIQYALSVPDRWASPLPRLDLTRLSALRFFEPDLERFPCLRLALEAAAQGESACIALNGANDVAVQAYLDEQLAFAEIPRVIAETLERHQPVAAPNLDEILALDAWARRTAKERILQCSTR